MRGVCRQESVAVAQQLVAASVQGAGVQLLVNNAGICTVAPVEFFDLQSFRCGAAAAQLQAPGSHAADNAGAGQPAGLNTHTS
jgi:NAD(P)-dependent dehydrogenase (short-subunit alcohol dehydrogenase family)